jgi:hypothetical protein
VETDAPADAHHQSWFELGHFQVRIDDQLVLPFLVGFYYISASKAISVALLARLTPTFLIYPDTFVDAAHLNLLRFLFGAFQLADESKLQRTHRIFVHGGFNPDNFAEKRHPAKIYVTVGSFVFCALYLTFAHVELFMLSELPLFELQRPCFRISKDKARNLVLEASDTFALESFDMRRALPDHLPLAAGIVRGLAVF